VAVTTSPISGPNQLTPCRVFTRRIRQRGLQGPHHDAGGSPASHRDGLVVVLQREDQEVGLAASVPERPGLSPQAGRQVAFCRANPNLCWRRNRHVSNSYGRHSYQVCTFSAVYSTKLSSARPFQSWLHVPPAGAPGAAPGSVRPPFGRKRHRRRFPPQELPFLAAAKPEHLSPGMVWQLTVLARPSDVSGPSRHLLAATDAPEAGTPPLARGRGGVWTTGCLKLFSDLVRPFARGVLGRLDLLPSLAA